MTSLKERGKFLSASNVEEIFKSIAALPFVVFLCVVAGIAWFVEHSYNFCNGRGWQGLPYF